MKRGGLTGQGLLVGGTITRCLSRLLKRAVHDASQTFVTRPLEFLVDVPAQATASIQANKKLINTQNKMAFTRTGHMLRFDPQPE